MRFSQFLILAVPTALLAGCTIEKIADGGPAITRTIKVPARDVAVYSSASEVPGRFTLIEDVYVKDDGSASPEAMERDLREIAGARGANALILAPMNRTLNGIRVGLGVHLDNPFDYFQGKAVWVGEGTRPVKIIRE